MRRLSWEKPTVRKTVDTSRVAIHPLLPAHDPTSHDCTLDRSGKPASPATVIPANADDDVPPGTDFLVIGQHTVYNYAVRTRSQTLEISIVERPKSIASEACLVLQEYIWGDLDYQRAALLLTLIMREGGIGNRPISMAELSKLVNEKPDFLRECLLLGFAEDICELSGINKMGAQNLSAPRLLELLTRVEPIEWFVRLIPLPHTYTGGVGAWIERRMAMFGYSTREMLATQIGVSASLVGKIISGERLIMPDTAVRLEEALDGAPPGGWGAQLMRGDLAKQPSPDRDKNTRSGLDNVESHPAAATPLVIGAPSNPDKATASDTAPSAKRKPKRVRLARNDTPGLHSDLDEERPVSAYAGTPAEHPKGMAAPSRVGAAHGQTPDAAPSRPARSRKTPVWTPSPVMPSTGARRSRTAAQPSGAGGRRSRADKAGSAES